MKRCGYTVRSVRIAENERWRARKIAEREVQRPVHSCFSIASSQAPVQVKPRSCKSRCSRIASFRSTIATEECRYCCKTAVHPAAANCAASCSGSLRAVVLGINGKRRHSVQICQRRVANANCVAIWPLMYGRRSPKTYGKLKHARKEEKGLRRTDRSVKMLGFIEKMAPSVVGTRMRSPPNTENRHHLHSTLKT